MLFENVQYAPLSTVYVTWLAMVSGFVRTTRNRVRLSLNNQARSARAAANLAGLLVLALVFAPPPPIDLPSLGDDPNHLVHQIILAGLPRIDTLRDSNDFLLLVRSIKP